MINSKFRFLYLQACYLLLLSCTISFSQSFEITEITFKGITSFSEDELIDILHSEEDEEFDARASILFDQTAASQLPLDALLADVNLTIGALLKNAAESGK